MTSPERVAVIGTGLVGTSIALAAIRAGDEVTGFDTDPAVLGQAAASSTLRASQSLEEAVAEATIVFICTPVPAIARLVVATLDAAAGALVSDVASVKSHVLAEVEAAAAPGNLARFVGGHPMSGSERSGPGGASASLLDDIVWVLTPSPASDAVGVDRLQAWITKVGARPICMDAERHDRLVAIVSHLPQVASTALMGLAAREEAGEPEILLLAAGGFRDLTRLAASNPRLWSDILVANRRTVATAIDLYVERLTAMRDMVLQGRAANIEEAFAEAKEARLTLGAKPQVRSGVAVFQVPVPDRPGVLAELTATLGEAGVNIEDLQIVHSPEGGRGTVHLTVASASAGHASGTLAERGFEPLRLA